MDLKFRLKIWFKHDYMKDSRLIYRHGLDSALISHIHMIINLQLHQYPNDTHTDSLTLTLFPHLFGCTNANFLSRISIMAALALLTSTRFILGMIGRGGCFNRVSEGVGCVISMISLLCGRVKLRKVIEMGVKARTRVCERASECICICCFGLCLRLADQPLCLRAR